MRQDRQCLYRRIIVVQRLSHPHEDQIADTLSRLKITLDSKDLINYLTRLQMPN